MSQREPNANGWLVTASLTLTGSFLFPPISIPLQMSAICSFIAYEAQVRHDERYLKPVRERKYSAWLATLDAGYEMLAGNMQAVAGNRLDWKTRQLNQRLNLRGSIDEKYLTLFTAGRQALYAPVPQPQQEEAEVEQELEQELEPQVDFSNGHDLPEGTRQPWVTQPQQTVDTVAATVVSKSDEPPLLRLESLISASLLIIWGTQGGRKTTLAKRITKMREMYGHAITVADPHGSKAEWGNWEVIGSGRDYERLDEFLREYDEEITADYQLYSIGKRDFDWSTLLADEFTQWSDEVSRSAKFVKCACSDIRKIRKCVILVSHSDTLTGLGGAAGMRDAINRSAVRLELETEIDINTGEYVATGYGWIKYPGKPRQRVKIPD